MKDNILVLLKPNQTKKEQYTEMLIQYQEICEKLNKDIGFYCGNGMYRLLFGRIFQHLLIWRSP